MTSPTASQSITPPKTAKASPMSSGADLMSSQGKTSIVDGVVQKIAGIATREVSGVYKLGAGAARAFGATRERVPGSLGPSVSQGVAVEVGERQAAVDLDVVVEYGVSIPDLAQSIRRNVINLLERMTGPEVTEVNVSVDDIHLPDDEDSDQQGSPRPVSSPALHEPDPDAIATAVLACRTVAGLSGGIAGEVATYLPGRRVTGVRIDDATVTAHVVGRYGPSMTEISTDVTRAVTPLAGGRQVEVVIEDIGLPGTPADPGAGPAGAGPAPAPAGDPPPWRAR